MDRETRRLVEEFRRNDAGPIENNLIDELIEGDLDRQEFLRRASVFGLGAGTIGLLLRYIGEADLAFAAPVAAKAGGTLRVGMLGFGSSLEPYQLREAGSLGLAGIPGEYLTFSNPALQVKPWLATSWKPNADGTVWTFQLRQGVKFHNGKTMTADDVVASFKQYLSQNDVSDPRLDSPEPHRPGGRGQDGAVHGAVPPEVAERRNPVARQPDDVPGDHPACRDRGKAWHVGCERHDRDRSLPGQELYAEQTSRARPLPALLGRSTAARRGSAHVLRRLGPDGPRAPSGADRPVPAAVPAGGPRLQEQQPVQGLHLRRRRTTRCSACGSTATRSGIRECGGRSL